MRKSAMCSAKSSASRSSRKRSMHMRSVSSIRRRKLGISLFSCVFSALNSRVASANSGDSGCFAPFAFASG